MGRPTAMFRILVAVAHGLRSFLRSRYDLAIENAALRQQLTVLKRAQRRPLLRGGYRLFWVLLRHVWSGWAETLTIVKPRLSFAGTGKASANTGDGSRGGGRPRSNRGIRSKKSYLAAQYRRLAGRRGKKRAAMAVAHSILVIAYHILRDGVPYADLGSDFFDRRAKPALAARFKRRLEALGYSVTIEEAG